jgi:hypothetical protein
MVLRWLLATLLKGLVQNFRHTRWKLQDRTKGLLNFSFLFFYMDSGQINISNTPRWNFLTLSVILTLSNSSWHFPTCWQKFSNVSFIHNGIFQHFLTHIKEFSLLGIKSCADLKNVNINNFMTKGSPKN